MKHWFQKGAAVLTAALLMGQTVSASAAAQPVRQEESLKIASLSDTHYLSPTLIKDTEDFTEHLNSDRKMFAESEAFLNALLDTVKKDDPDVLLISGDLTKDGEREGHEALAGILERFEEETGAQVYITPGNHDLNNSNAMNFNTDSGEAVPAGRTTPEDYKRIYADLVYNDDSVIASFVPAEGKQGGSLSYAARPKDGFTILSIDSARYSADNTDSGTDEHETSGNVGPELEAWVVEQIQAARQRGDTVIGLQHHGMVPHFSMEPDLLPMYLVNDYERLAAVYADAGMSYIFTGHMHANDIATVTTEAGNTLYDIETGSVVTYPSPARCVTFTRTIENGTVKESMDIRTYTGVGPVTFTNPVTGEEQTVEDITEYGKAHGFSNDMLTTTVNGFLHDYYAQIAQAGGIRPVLVALVNSLMGESVQFRNFDELISVGLPKLLPSKEENGAVYYDYSQSGMVIDTTGSSFELQLLIPTAGLLQTLNVLLDKLDEEIRDPAELDQTVTALTESLTAIPVVPDGETPKNLLDYANYIYQSHLGGEDSTVQPEWVKATAQKIQNGELVDNVIDVLVKNLSDLLNQILDHLSVSETLGITGWNNNEGTKDFVAADNRTPLLRPYNQHGNTQTTLALIFGPLGADWPTDADDTKVFTVPSLDYSLGSFLDDFNGSFAGRLYSIDIHALLDELINGTPADPEEGTPAEEGLLTEEMRGQLSGWLLGLVTSMGTDSNYPEDNHTTIACQWKLLTDRTALDAAIAEAEALDLTPYTAETAQAVTDALTAAQALPLTATQGEMDNAADAIRKAISGLKEIVTIDRAALETAIAQAQQLDLSRYTAGTAQAVTNALTAAMALPETATQEEIDAAAKALTDALSALEEKANGGTDAPDDSRPQIPDNSGTGNLEDGSTDTPTEIPQTGEGVAVYPLLLLILSAGGLVLALRLKKRVH